MALTAGVGGSLLKVGSVADVVLMEQARGQYTFFSHLKWTPLIAPVSISDTQSYSEMLCFQFSMGSNKAVVYP